MTKQRQSATLGSVNDFTSTPPMTDTERITALEKRVATLEDLLNDVMHQLDQPNTQPKSKQNGKPKGNEKPKVQKSKPPTPEPKKEKPKKTPPSQILAALLKQKPHSRAEMEASTGMDTEAIRKCVTWMTKQDLIEKTTEKDDDGNSRWSLKE
jgi:hypothetical protein